MNRDKRAIYFLKCGSGWNAADTAFSAITGLDKSLDICRSRGYKVIKKDGVTTRQANEFLQRPDNHGTFFAGCHGDLMGIQLDPFKKGGQRVTLTDYFDKDKPWKAITDSPTKNLKFAVFHACNISSGTLKGYKKRLRKTAKEVDVYGWPGENLYSVFALKKTIQDVCSRLPDATRTPAKTKRPAAPGKLQLLLKTAKKVLAGSPRKTAAGLERLNDFTRKYKFKSGDTVWGKAGDNGYSNPKAFIRDFAKLNRGVDPKHVFRGTTYVMPYKAKSTTVSDNSGLQMPGSRRIAAKQTAKLNDFTRRLTFTRGDTVWGKAAEHGYSNAKKFVRDFAKLNRGVNPSKVFAGQTYVMPYKAKSMPLSGKGGIQISGSRRTGTVQASKLNDFMRKYEFKRGDTVWAKAGDCGYSNPKSFVRDFAKLNRGVNPSKVFAGQSYVMPYKGKSASFSGAGRLELPGSRRAASISQTSLNDFTHRYTFRRGDTVWGKAGDFGYSNAKTFVRDFARLNSGVNPNHVLAGRAYTMPYKGAW